MSRTSSKKVVLGVRWAGSGVVVRRWRFWVHAMHTMVVSIANFLLARKTHHVSFGIARVGSGDDNWAVNVVECGGH